MCKIKLVRIDSRLSHGKTVESWCSKYQLKNVIIANERVAADDFRKQVMNLTIPDGVKAYYIKPKQVKDFLKANDGNYFVIVESANDLEILINDNIELENVNIGIIHMSEGKKSLTEEVAVDDNDLRIFKNLVDKGVNVAVRLSPYSTERSLNEYLIN